MAALTWIAMNWKALLPTVLLVGGGTIAYAQDVDARLDANASEIVDVRKTQISNYAEIREDISDIRCMTIKVAQGFDPLVCIE